MGINTTKSQSLFEEAQRLMPGGVNSPVRAFKAVGGSPLFIERGLGSKIVDVDRNTYIDYVLSWGPLILGHAHPKVVRALVDGAGKGSSFGAPTPLENRLAELVIDAFPSIERVRFVNSGTEACMSVIRLARAFTKRDLVVKFEGCYHGHADGLLVKAGSGATTLGVPTSPGVPQGYAQNTLCLPYNDLEAVQEALRAHGREIACVIVEPVAGNMGVILPKQGFLEGLRKETRKYDIVLIFDEVITGFRLSRAGAQGLYGIEPDLTCLGKIIGGGLPVGAYGGKAEIMSLVSPQGPVYQAGTLSGNPLAMASGLATLEVLNQPGTYEKLEEKGKKLEEGLRKAAQRVKVPVVLNRLGSMMTLFFSTEPVVDYQSALRADTAQYSSFFQRMLQRGIYLAPSQFEAAFLSTAHTEEDIFQTIDAFVGAMRDMKEGVGVD